MYWICHFGILRGMVEEDSQNHCRVFLKIMNLFPFHGRWGKGE